MTPTEEVMRNVFGMTNDEIATALKAAGMEGPKHVKKPDATAWQQAEALLSNPSYMAKLSRAVAKFPRNIADYENDALNVLFRQRQDAVNKAQGVVDGLKETLDAFDRMPISDSVRPNTFKKRIHAPLPTLIPSLTLSGKFWFYISIPVC